MKHVFETSEVAHIWAHQSQNDGRNACNNLYFNGKTIYSYGRHFPIATIDGTNVLFTLATYSVTTAKHISEVRQAVTHMNVIYCYDVPTDLRYVTGNHENNFNYWKREIKKMVAEIGNTKNRDITGRINVIARNVEQLNAYCEYFKIKVKDTELKKLLLLTSSPEFVIKAREAKAKENAANEKKMKLAAKAFDISIDLWRNFDEKGIQDLPVKTKELANYYQNNVSGYTRLRFNTSQNRVETSKGVQIPAEVAKRAYIQLNGCMVSTCNGLAIPVMNYTITETTKDYIKAGCHTIPKEDIKYIAALLNW